MQTRKLLRLTMAATAMAASLSTWADPIDATRAKKIAETYCQTVAGPRLVKSTVRKAPARIGTEQTSPVYVFSRGDGQGFVIVSGDDCLPEVLAVVDSGDWDESVLPPMLLDWVEGYSELIEAAQAANAPARSTKRKSAGTKTIDPLCQTHWHQSWPYYNRCPWRNDDPNSRCLTGCVATAAAQVVYYWHRDNPDVSGNNTPTYGYGSPVTESVPAGTPLKWDLMQMNYGGSTPSEMCDAVSDLMFITGASTWLTYGSSTSGQISNLVNTFNGQYRLSSTCWYKEGNAQSYWEKIIVEDLEAGHPIVYSGVHPSNGGHAVVLDGYNHRTNLFHFNFGWGGQGDGWYTVDDETGMNGFNGQQGMTFRIQPKKYNTAGRIENIRDGGTLMQRVDNTIRVSLTNHSTVPLTGIYLFCMTGKSLPSKIENATRKDVTTVVGVDEKCTVDLSFKPTLSSSVYTLYLTDKSLTILDKVENITVNPTTCDLILNNLSVNGATLASEPVAIDGSEQTLPVYTVYNTLASVTASITNGEEGTLCQPTLSCQLSAYDATSGAFNKSTTKSNTSTQLDAGESKQVTFSFTSLSPDKLYAAQMVSSTSYPINGSEAQTVYFRVTSPDLAITPAEEKTAVVTGHWNEDAFFDLATDEGVTAYDLSAVTGSIIDPLAANPNALFFTNEDADAKGNNVVCGNVCRRLDLTAGYPFGPIRAFHASEATYHAPVPIATWQTLTCPFDATVPSGTLARRVTGRRDDGTVNKADSVNSIIQADSLFVVLSADKELCLVSTDADVPMFRSDLNTDVNVKVSVGLTTKDTNNKKLATTIADAAVLLGENDGEEDSAARRALTEAIYEARGALTRQPELAEVKGALKLLTDAMDAYTEQRTVITDEGWTDITSLITNPSFEKNTTGWKVQKVTGQTSSVITASSSLANFMARMDGTKYYSLTYKAGTAPGSISQQLTGLPRGYYRLAASVCPENKCHAGLFAQTTDKADTTTVAVSAFGPMYFQEIVVDSILVQDGLLTIGVTQTDGGIKADNFRLYFIANDPTPVTSVMADKRQANHTGIYTMTGLKIDERTDMSRLPKGIYIINGKKVSIR